MKPSWVWARVLSTVLYVGLTRQLLLKRSSEALSAYEAALRPWSVLGGSRYR